MTVARRSVHHTSFLGALVQVVVRSIIQCLPTVIGAGFPRRAGGVGDAVVGTAEDQHLDQFVEDDAVGDAESIPAEGKGHLVRRQQCVELVPDRLDDG